MDGQGNFIAGFVHGMGQAAKGSLDYLSHLAEEARERFADAAMKAKTSVSKAIHSQPSGALIKPCPKNMKAQRVEERKTALAGSKARLADMPPGKQREALAQATERFERNNVAVERARLAKDVYKVGQGDPPEGWYRFTAGDLRNMGMTKAFFPQVGEGCGPRKIKDGYYAELYGCKSDIFGEEHYVLCFRGTQGLRDGLADLKQAFGGETDQYTRAIKTAQKLKRVFGEKLDITGHSMGGGMATAAGIVTDTPVCAIDPAGVHPHTLERFGKEYSRKAASRLVQNYVADGELLDVLQHPASQAVLLAAASSAFPPLGLLITTAGYRGLEENGSPAYGAAGPINRLPVIANAHDISDGRSEQGMLPGILGRANNKLNMLKRIRLHDAEYVIAGIEQQKADDLTVMKSS